ncbi:MAG: DUF4038 domain-containing protein [Chitinophagaceae bacterium]|nr:DUF4038 domain-containing protein [Chitinophagaceae bacterium]
MRVFISIIFLLAAIGHLSAQNFSYKKSSEGIEISENKKRVLFFQAKPKSVQGKYERAGYIHPLYGLNGNVLTEDMPADHPYHRGIFWAWHQVVVDGKNIADGWTSDGIAFVPGKMQVTKSDRNVIITSQLTWKTVDSSKPSVNIVNETSRINILSAKENYRIIDFNILLKPLVDNLSLGGSDDPKGYGGFCWRIKLPEHLQFISGDQQVEPKETAVMAGPWMDFNTKEDGIAVFGYSDGNDTEHPWILRKAESMQNVPYPGRTPVAIPKEGWELKYRVVIHNDKLTPKELDALYNEYKSTQAQLKISEDKHYFVTNSGKPFFWLGDTAWELFHRLTREEADMYLEDRAAKGFTVIQAVILAELDGLNTPNAYGEKPLIDNDPTKPNEKYFEHVDYIVNKAEKLGMTIGMLPSWGDKWNKSTWGLGPEIFTPGNARIFGEYLGKRYRDKRLVWIMGGDRDIMDDEDRNIINSMVEGLKAGDGGNHLFTFHPQGGKSSSDFFKDAEWLNFHMSQTGHSVDSKNYQFNIRHRTMTPLHPHLDGEPRYEDHPNNFNPAKEGWMDDFDARQTAYWSMLSGACGHTYGNHNIWQMYTEERKPVSWARTNWKVALDQPGSMQVGFMRKMLEKRKWQRLVPAQEIIPGENPEDKGYVVASLSQDGDFLLVYTPYGRKFRIKTEGLKAESLKGWWFNPRDGRSISLGTFSNTREMEFTPHSEGRGSDWVLVLDDAGKNYDDPAIK